MDDEKPFTKGEITEAYFFIGCEAISHSLFEATRDVTIGQFRATIRRIVAEKKAQAEKEIKPCR